MPEGLLTKVFGLTPPKKVNLNNKIDYDKIAREQQAQLPLWKQYAQSAMDIPPNIVKGFLGIDPASDESNAGYLANVLTQIGQAALPLAVPRNRHRQIIDALKKMHYSKLSPEYSTLISDWTSGVAMSNPTRNLQIANKLREHPDSKLIQNYLRDTLQTNTIPVYRGVNEDEMGSIMKYYQNNEDPGIRSFSLEPKVTHSFADPRTGWFEDVMDINTMDPKIRSLRANRGAIYKVNAPVDSILGFGNIPAQRELIVDLKGLNPKTRMQVLRDKTAR